MAVRKINESTLTAIGNAIRAKTGGSALINPEDMADEIDSIQTGGGSSGGMKLLSTYTATEDVSAIKIDFTTAMQGYDVYVVKLEGTVTGSIGPYFGINTETNTRYYGQLTGSHKYVSLIYQYNDLSDNGMLALIGGSGTQTIASPLQYLHIRAFNTSSVIKSGTTVQIWGGNYENS